MQSVAKDTMCVRRQLGKYEFKLLSRKQRGLIFPQSLYESCDWVGGGKDQSPMFSESNHFRKFKVQGDTAIYYKEKRGPL